MKFQANIPFKLTKLFYEKLGEQPVNKRILVIRDFFTAMHASIDNAVTFVTDDKEAYELFNKNVVSNDEFGNDDTVLLVDTEINKNAWKDFIKEIVSMPKFDVAIMNPPYDKNLHLKILEAVIPIAAKVVNISPVRWLQDPLAKYKKNSDYKHFEDSISKKIKDLIIIPADKANDLFNIAAFGDLGIYVLCNNGGYDYTQISKLSLGVSHNICSKMLNKLSDTLKNHYTLGCQTDYNVKVTDICGSLMGFVVNKIHNRIYKNELEYKNNKVKKSDCHNINKGELFISFNTSVEAENFLKSVYTKFHRYIVLSLQNDVHVPLFALPFMGDYTQPWDDKRFCDYFNITGYIDDDHAEPNSEWEIILNTMKEYE